MRYLFLFLLCVGSAWAADITATSVTRADVGTAYATCVDGDRLIIPAGSATWDTNLHITKDIDIVGAGGLDGATTITDNIIKANGSSGNSNFNEAAFSFLPPVSSLVRISGIKFIPGTYDAGRDKYSGGVIQTDGTARYVLTDIWTNYLIRRSFFFWGRSSGVVSGCQFDIVTGEQACVFYQNNIFGGQYGDGSYVNPPAYGTADEWFYVEDCVTNGPVGGGLNMTDGFAGSKFVVRFCDINDIGVGQHGTDSTNRYRGTRAFEVYHNTFDDTSGSADYATIEMRSGCGKVFNNTSTGTWNYDIVMGAYRNWFSFVPWGVADGTHLWDVANLTDGAGTPGGAGDGVFESGTADNANSKNWTDTAGITMTQSTGTVTASSAIFTAGMVGSSIYVPTNEVYENIRTITGFTSSTVVTATPAWNIASASPFVIGGENKLEDTTKSWSPSDKWVGYTLREKTGDFTATGGASRSLTVSGAGWTAGQWVGWTMNKASNNTKFQVDSNTTDTISTSTSGPSTSFAASDVVYFSRASNITDSTATVISTGNQGSVGVNNLTYSGIAYEIRKVDSQLDAPGRGTSDALSSADIQIQHQDLNQQLDPIYFINNKKNGTKWTEITSNLAIVKNREYYIEPTTFNASSGGAGYGTASAMAAITPSVNGVGFWVTDEGEWNSNNGATTDGRLYVWNGSAWVLDYTPYSYPHPLLDTGPDVTPPTLSTITVNGSTVTWGFSEPVTNMNLANWSFSTGSLSVLSGAGEAYTATLTPPGAYGSSFTANYTQGTTQDGAANLLANISARAVTNNTPGGDVTPPTLSTITVNGSAVAWTFSESVSNFNTANWAFSTGSLSSQAGSGASYTATLTPAASYGASLTIDYTPGTTQDAATNALAEIDLRSVTNNTPDPGTPSSVNKSNRPNGVGKKF